MSNVKFIVLTSSRTGSTWLIDRLNSQSGAEAHGELFLDRPRVSPAIAGRDDYCRFIEVHGTPGATRAFRVFSYLNGLYQRPGTVGFKLMYAHLRSHPEILAYIAVRRVVVVHLVRRNLLDVLVSEELARVTGTSHVPTGMKRDVPQVYIKPETLIDRLSRRRSNTVQVSRLLRLSSCRYLEVTYEELLGGEQEFERIAKFLGFSQWSTSRQSNIEKRGTGSHRYSIANYNEIRRALESTPFLSLLR